MGKPNILFIVMDTARAQSALPSENPGVMPNLKDLAEEGTAFPNTVSTAPWTLPSHASMFTGQYTSDHQTHTGDSEFCPDVPTLAETLRDVGYQTVAISNNTWVTPEFGFGKGFQRFYRGWELIGGGMNLPEIVREGDNRFDQLHKIIKNVSIFDLPPTLINVLYARFFHRRYDYGALATNLRSKQFISQEWNGSQPLFMFLNYLEPHLKYDPPKPFRYQSIPKGINEERVDEVSQKQWEYIAGNISMSDRDFQCLEALYEGELRYLDHRLGNLFKYLKENGVWDETLVIVAGDHGENIGEHDLMDHQYCLYDTLLRVPLIMKPPATTALQLNVEPSSLIELRDVYPTIIEFAGAKAPKTKTVSSRSLVASQNHGRSTSNVREYAFAEYLVPQPDVDKLRSKSNSSKILDEYDQALRCVRTNHWKFIMGSDGSLELYNIESDPHESDNIVEKNPDVADELKHQIEHKFGQPELNKRAEEKRTAEDRLRDLGYI